MKLIIDIPDNYDISAIQNGSVASKRLLNAIKEGKPYKEETKIEWNYDEIKKLMDKYHPTILNNYLEENLCVKMNMKNKEWH